MKASSVVKPEAEDEDFEAEPVVKKAPVKKAKRKPKKSVKDEEYEEVASEAKKLQSKFSSRKRTKEDDMAFLKVKNWDTKPIVRNCEAHNNTVSRAAENQISKMYQIDFRPNVMSTCWKCALCGQRSAVGDLGDLFGPYYVENIDDWPTFLAKKPSKGSRAKVSLDVWFHGDCILWAPNVHMCGNQLTNLGKQLPVFWKQTCAICHHEGAAIPVAQGKHVHYPCARKNGYKMDETLFSCHL